MPLYEYQCAACGHDFEWLARSAQAADEPACPKCGGANVDRRLSVFATHQGAAAGPTLGGACGRCGDPNGPCGTG